jgi:hypothetical protein
MRDHMRLVNKWNLCRHKNKSTVASIFCVVNITCWVDQLWLEVLCQEELFNGLMLIFVQQYLQRGVVALNRSISPLFHIDSRGKQHANWRKTLDSKWYQVIVKSISRGRVLSKMKVTSLSFKFLWERCEWKGRILLSVMNWLTKMSRLSDNKSRYFSTVLHQIRWYLLCLDEMVMSDAPCLVSFPSLIQWRFLGSRCEWHTLSRSK